MNNYVVLVYFCNFYIRPEIDTGKKLFRQITSLFLTVQIILYYLQIDLNPNWV